MHLYFVKVMRVSRGLFKQSFKVAARSNNLNIGKMKGVRVTNIYLLELIIFVKKTVACIQLQSSVG